MIVIEMLARDLDNAFEYDEYYINNNSEDGDVCGWYVPNDLNEKFNRYDATMLHPYIPDEDGNPVESFRMDETVRIAFDSDSVWERALKMLQDSGTAYKLL